MGLLNLGKGALALAMIMSLSACGGQLIKPQDKHIEAMVQFEMPDYDQSTQNVVQKAQAWLDQKVDKQSGKTELIDSNGNVVTGQGYVTFKTRGENLTVRFNIKVTAIKPSLIQFTTNKYVDQPGPRVGDSDQTYIFYNLVKDRVLGLADELEDYMNEDLSEETLLDSNT